MSIHIIAKDAKKAQTLKNELESFGRVENFSPYSPSFDIRIYKEINEIGVLKKLKELTGVDDESFNKLLEKLKIPPEQLEDTPPLRPQM